MAKVKITEEFLNNKVKELCKAIEEFDGDRAGFASWTIIEIVAYAQSSYFEAIGIIQDAVMEYKKLAEEPPEEAA